MSLLAGVPPSTSAAAEPKAAQKPVAERPDRVSAMLTARQQKSRVEITGERTETTSTWANPDGTLTTEVFSGPVRTRDAKGTLVPIDLTLVADGQVLRPKAGLAQVGISATGGKDPFATVEQDGKSLSVAWPSELGKPEVAGNTATFKNAVPGGDLVVRALKSGLRYDLVLHQKPTGPLKLRLPIKAEGLKLAKAKHGGLTAADAKGRKVADGPTPRMWDASAGASPLSPAVEGRRSKVATSIENGKDGQVLVLEPDTQFLSDPATKYPVTVDPTLNLAPVADAAVNSAEPTMNYGSAPTMDVGSWTDQPWRGLIKFDASALTGKKILSAKLNMQNVYAKQCADTGAGVQIRRITSTWSASTVTWNTQPTTTDAGAAVSTDAHGFDTSCPAAVMPFDATAITQAWADGQANHGLALQATPETDPSGFRVFTSSENTNPPALQVTYNTAPATPASTGLTPYKAWNGTIYSGVNPQLFGTATDPEGGYVRLDFEALKSDDTALWSGSSSYVASGQKATVDIPQGILSNGMLWKWRVRSFDGNAYSAWTSYNNHEADGIAPAAPAIWCQYEHGVWSAKRTGDVRCTLSSTSDDGQAFRWSIDAEHELSSTIAYGTTPEFTIQPQDGWHVIHAQTEDGLGNRSESSWYHFGVGQGGLVSPADGDRTQQFAALASSARPEKNGVTYQYRTNLTSQTAWKDIPVGQVTLPGTGQPGQGTALPSWPYIRTDASKDFPGLNWDVTRTLKDGLIEVRACHSAPTGGFDCTSGNALTIERNSFGASQAVQELGPGRLALHTGDLAIDASDVGLAGLSVDRSHTTLKPANATDATGVFGPGWSAGFPAEEGAAGYKFEDHSAEGYVLLKGLDGETLTYLKQTNGTFAGVSDAADTGTFTKDSATKFTLTGNDGVTTVFTYANGTWGPDSTDMPGAENKVTYVRDGQGRVTTVLGSVPEGVTCTASSIKPGCAALKIHYSSTTTATGVGSGWGSYAGTLQRVDYIAHDPASSGMKTTAVAEYRYDSTGHLRQTWDPRISPNLVTTYYYDAEGRLSQITPPGQAPWKLEYDTTNKRLAHVSRTDSQGRNVIEAVAYDVPVAGSTAPVNLGGTASGAWAQTSGLPLEGTAIFPASHVPSRAADGSYWSNSSGNEWKYAELYYQDVNGRTVNTAAFGAGAWQVDATRYDKHGRTIWALSAENRAQALNPTQDTDPYVTGRNTSAERANLLATATTYNDFGDVLTTTGPAHRVQLASGAMVSARAFTENTYNEGRPSTSTDYHLITTTKVRPLVLDGGEAPASADTRTVKNGYAALAPGDSSGWELRQPTSVTQLMPGGSDITTRTRYDRAGRVIETRQPASSGTDAGTTAIVHYTADTNPEVAACGLKPQWAGLVCRTGPKVQPVGKTLPTTTVQYGYYGQATKSIETSSGTTRTATASYDAAGRPTGSSLTVNPAVDGGQTVPDTVITYHQATGLQATVSAGGKTVTTQYDSFGRQTSYHDATGNTATAEYTIDSQIAVFNDGKGTYTYTYNGNDNQDREERRGLVTRVDTGLPNGAGVIRSGYDGDGRLIGQWQPTAQMWTTRRYDAIGRDTGLGYGSGNGTTWMWFSQNTTVHGQASQSSGPAGIQDYAYDHAGRLTRVQDHYYGWCTTRTYALDANTNRTSASSRPPAADGTCTTGTATTTTSSYDAADRITDAGYTYDNLGRTLSLPTDHVTGGNNLTVGYHVNDMVASLTQGTQTRTFDLDPTGRISQMTKPEGTLTNHYAGSSDNPSWITEADGSWTRNVNNAGLAAIHSSDGTTTLQFANLHGDIVATTALTTGVTGIDAYFEQTEYGTPRPENTTNPDRYGWLGDKLRSNDALAGLTLMGVRLYNPNTGRFLSEDPVPGANENAYTYPGDPINSSDTSGACPAYSSNKKKVCLSKWTHDRTTAWRTQSIDPWIPSRDWRDHLALHWGWINDWQHYRHLQSRYIIHKRSRYTYKGGRSKLSGTEWRLQYWRRSRIQSYGRVVYSGFGIAVTTKWSSQLMSTSYHNRNPYGG